MEFAVRFFTNHIQSRSNAASMTCIWASNQLPLNARSLEENPSFFVFTPSSGKGFVIVAGDDDEEKYYVKYQVTAKTRGSGWIDQVKINVDGRPMKTGKPINEGESFTYTGSKVYKDKSELPTISCEGILINGVGNIQSVPASINVSTKL